MPPVQYPAHARASEIIPPGLCTPHDRSGRSLLQWLPTEWSVCPIECGARCTQHRDYQCRCIYFIEHGSWDLAKRFSEDICTRSIRSHGGVARRSEPNFTAAWRDRTLRAATGLRAQDNGELGADDHTLRRAARLQCCTVHVVSQPAHRRPPSPPHMRFCMACFGSADLGCASIGECHQRWTGWRLSGVRAQSRAAWGSSSAWCASLPSSAFELLLVHPSMSPAQPLEYPWHPPCTACSGQIATLRHAIRRSVALVNHGRLAGVAPCDQQRTTP